CGRRRLLGECKALDQAWQAVRLAAADDPLEEAAVLLAELVRRVARADPARRVGEAEQVTVRHTVPLAVLDRLVGERLGRAARVPAADCATQRAAPAAEALGEGPEP